MTRRDLLKSMAVLPAFGSHPLPSHSWAECYLWLVLVGGHCHGAEGLDQLDAVQAAARADGFEALDRRHHVDAESNVLVRKPMSLREARAMERQLIHGEGDLPVVSIWIQHCHREA